MYVAVRAAHQVREGHCDLEEWLDFVELQSGGPAVRSLATRGASQGVGWGWMGGLVGVARVGTWKFIIDCFCSMSTASTYTLHELLPPTASAFCKPHEKIISGVTFEQTQ